MIHEIFWLKYFKEMFNQLVLTNIKAWDIIKDWNFSGFISEPLRCIESVTNEARWLFSSHFWPLLKQIVFFEATGPLAKIGFR